jgi:hypothetical protein
MLSSQSSRSWNADAQVPPNLPTLDEDGGGAHQWLMQPVLGHEGATDSVIKRSKVGMEDALKLGDMRALTPQHLNGCMQPSQTYPSPLLLLWDIHRRGLHLNNRLLHGLARHEDFR